MKPILFNTDMVKAILDGKKTVTRRLIKTGEHEIIRGAMFPGAIDGAKYGAELDDRSVIVSPFQPDDIMYVRETYDVLPVDEDGKLTLVKRYFYRAGGDHRPEAWRGNWKPSIHMPKEAARLFLRVTDVRVERLQDILEDPPGPKNQVVREGFRYTPDFIATWENTIKKSDLNRYGWDANPWVWVISFERCEKPQEDKP